jgi:hypothetical protein
MSQPLDLAAIRGRHEMYAAIHSASGAFAHCAAQESAEDVPALLDEVTRLLEATGHDEDAINFLDGWADYDQHAAPTTEA